MTPIVDAGRRLSLSYKHALAAVIVGTSMLVVPLARSHPQPAPLQPPPTAARTPQNLYVAPNGTAGASGALNDPLRLDAALSDESPAMPGDVVFLRGGTYRGPFTSVVSGLESARITFRRFPGERAIIDPALTIVGSWTTFRDLEFTTATPQRRSAERGSWPADIRSGGVSVRGPQTQLINLVIHDVSSGIGMWSESVGSIAYGNVIFHNGWRAPDRAHGHGIYTQNKDGLREIADNIVFEQFSHGIHAYGSSEAYLDNITLRGNVVFNNGLVSDYGPERDILLGGGRVAHHALLEENFTYGPAQSNVGYAAGCVAATIVRNYFVGSSPLILKLCQPTMRDNVFVGAMHDTAEAYPRNQYVEDRPSGQAAFVRPNRFDSDRFHIIVYNWDHQPQVTIDAPPSLPDGARFEVMDVLNYFGAPVLSATHRRGSAIVLPMASLKRAPNRRDGLPDLAHTAPEFAVFILRILPVSTTMPALPHPDTRSK